MPNPVKDSTNVQIRLIRTPHDQTKDDTLTIEDAGGGYFRLYYHDADFANTDLHHFTLLSGTEVDTYINNLFYLLVHDRQPFHGIQFTIPCFPTILFRIDDLKKGGIRESLGYILPLLSSCLKITNIQDT
jgi:hypothetical protein